MIVVSFVVVVVILIHMQRGSHVNNLSPMGRIFTNGYVDEEDICGAHQLIGDIQRDLALSISCVKHIC